MGDSTKDTCVSWERVGKTTVLAGDLPSWPGLCCDHSIGHEALWRRGRSRVKGDIKEKQEMFESRGRTKEVSEIPGVTGKSHQLSG